MFRANFFAITFGGGIWAVLGGLWLHAPWLFVIAILLLSLGSVGLINVLIRSDHDGDT